MHIEEILYQEGKLMRMQMQRNYGKHNQANWQNHYQNQRSKITDVCYIGLDSLCIKNLVQFESWLIIHRTDSRVKNIVLSELDHLPNDVQIATNLMHDQSRLQEQYCNFNFQFW